jgi:hypothetical protein
MTEVIKQQQCQTSAAMAGKRGCEAMRSEEGEEGTSRKEIFGGKKNANIISDETWRILMHMPCFYKVYKGQPSAFRYLQSY